MTGDNTFLRPDGSLNFNSLSSKITPEKVALDFKGMRRNRFANVVELQQGASAINSMNTMQKAREVLAHYENQIARGMSEGEASKPFRNDAFRDWYYTNKTNPDPKVQQMMALIPFKEKAAGNWGIIGKLFGVGQADDEEASRSFVPGAVAGGGAYVLGSKITSAEDVLKEANKTYTSVKSDWRQNQKDITAKQTEIDKFKQGKGFTKKGLVNKRLKAETQKKLQSELDALVKESEKIKDKAKNLAKDVEKASEGKLKSKGKQYGKGMKSAQYLLKGLALVHGGGAIGEAIAGDIGRPVGELTGTAILTKDFWKWAGGKLARKLGTKASILGGLALVDGPLPVGDAISLLIGAGISMWEIKSLIDEYEGK